MKRYAIVVGGLALAWLLHDLYWAWWEDHQALASPPQDTLIYPPGRWRDTNE